MVSLTKSFPSDVLQRERGHPGPMGETGRPGLPVSKRNQTHRALAMKTELLQYTLLGCFAEYERILHRPPTILRVTVHL